MFGDNRFIDNTLEKDNTKNTDEALIEIYEKLKPGEPATLDSAKNQLIVRFFDRFRYDLAKVGRYKFNKKLNCLLYTSWRVYMFILLYESDNL